MPAGYGQQTGSGYNSDKPSGGGYTGSEYGTKTSDAGFVGSGYKPSGGGYKSSGYGSDISPGQGYASQQQGEYIVLAPQHIVLYIVARRNTGSARRAASKRASDAVFYETAASEGGIRQILARAPLDAPNFCK